MIEIKMMLITFNRGSLHSSPMLCCVSKMPSTLKSAHHCSNWFPIVGLQPRWLLGFSLCRRWRGFWPGFQPREAVVVYLSNIAQDWDEQSGKMLRHFGPHSQLFDRIWIFLLLSYPLLFILIVFLHFYLPLLHFNTGSWWASELVLCTTCSNKNGSPLINP